MKFIQLIRNAIFCLFVISSALSYAGNTSMQVTLKRIDMLLNRINPLIKLAETQESSHNRVKFEFKKLRQDIVYIQSGIEQAMRPISIQPRIPPPVSGDYLAGFKKKHFLNQSKKLILTLR